MSDDTPDISEIREDLLPKSLQSICSVIGLSAAIKIASHYGGTRLWVPANMQVNHPLARLIGFDQAVKLCTRYRCEYLSIPRAARAIKAMRNAAIVSRYLAGEKAKSLAREYGIHERMIWYILSRQRRASGQMPLI